MIGFSTVKAVTVPEGIVKKITSGGKLLWERSGYTNLVPTSIDTDGSIYNGIGYKEGYRLNSSGTETAGTDMICSGFIRASKGDIIRIYGSTLNLSTATMYFNTYNGNFAKVAAHGPTTFRNATWTELNEKYMWTIDTAECASDFVYFRASMYKCTGTDFVITVNEEITG